MLEWETFFKSRLHLWIKAWKLEQGHIIHCIQNKHFSEKEMQETCFD